MLMLTDGYSVEYLANTPGSTYRQVASLAPMASEPCGVSPCSAIARMPSCRVAINRSAVSKNTRPASVRATDFVVRSNRRAPHSCSSCWICALTAGCERNSFLAALEKLLSLATSIKVMSWSKSIGFLPLPSTLRHADYSQKKKGLEVQPYCLLKPPSPRGNEWFVSDFRLRP